MRRHFVLKLEQLHPCHGVCCPCHLTCARYQFVDGTREPSAHWLPYCAPLGAHSLPGFIPVDFIGPPAPHHYRMTRRSVREAAQTVVDAVNSESFLNSA